MQKYEEMNKNLFEEFEEVSAKQWKHKIQYDLKGADYNETLIWNSNDGVDVKPFYHPDTSPDTFPINSPSNWDICEKIYAGSAILANEKAREAIEKGAESLWLRIPDEKVEPRLLFTEIDIENITVYVVLDFLSAEYCLKLQQEFSAQPNNLYILNDIIGHLARTGNWFTNLQKDHEALQKVTSEAKTGTSVLNVDVGLYQNAGANIPQQLGYALAHTNEYFDFLTKEGNSAVKPGGFLLNFSVSIGPNYFFEIAKLRALRLLYATLAAEYDFPEDCHILVQPSKRNKSLYDFNVNLLRSTTECMSAILGGADAITNFPYDALYHKDNHFSSRIARNQLLVLKNESYFEKVANPAEGSYYVETLTQQFAEKALAIFKDIEKGGGFLKQLKEGIIQKKISESAQKGQEEFDSGELILIGSNKYQNPEDRMKNELELYPFLKQNPRKTLIQPILERRLAEKLEQERLKKE